MTTSTPEGASRAYSQTETAEYYRSNDWHGAVGLGLCRATDWSPITCAGGVVYFPVLVHGAVFARRWNRLDALIIATLVALFSFAFTFVCLCLLVVAITFFQVGVKNGCTLIAGIAGAVGPHFVLYCLHQNWSDDETEARDQATLRAPQRPVFTNESAVRPLAITDLLIGMVIVAVGLAVCRAVDWFPPMCALALNLVTVSVHGVVFARRWDRAVGFKIAALTFAFGLGPASVTLTSIGLLFLTRANGSIVSAETLICVAGVATLLAGQHYALSLMHSRHQCRAPVARSPVVEEKLDSRSTPDDAATRAPK